MLLCACRVLVLVSALSVLTQNAAVAGQSIGRPDVIGNVKAGLFSRPVWPSSYKVIYVLRFPLPKMQLRETSAWVGQSLHSDLVARI